MQPLETTIDRALASRLGDSTVFAFWSKNRARRDAFARGVAGPDTVHLCPRVMLAHVSAAQPGSRVVALEDLPSRDVFLGLHALVGPETRLLIEGAARYTKIDGLQFRCLHRLRRLTRHRFLIDAVPFTTLGTAALEVGGAGAARKPPPISKLYLPLSYLGREILGYSHGYGFEYNYGEEDAEGRVRRAHDLDFLAAKVAPWCALDDEAFLPPIDYINVPLTVEERAEYQLEKTALFDRYDNPRKVVTRLCDAANLMPSRQRAILELLGRLPPGARAVVYTSISRNSEALRRAAGKALAARVRFTTFTVHDAEPIDAEMVVFAETPLNANQVSAIDVLADVRPGARVSWFRCDAKADDYLFGEVNPGLQAVDAFTRALASRQRTP